MRPLAPGDTIAIVSPASTAERRVFSEFQDLAAEHGYATKVFGEFDEGFGRMAADDRRRAENLQAAFADDSVAAILCSRGGYGSGRLLDIIDPAAIRPKIFVGYSDVTSLILHLSATAGIIPFHGPMAADLIGNANQWTRERFFSMLAGERLSYSLERADFTPVREGVARGPIVGGNISIIESLLGTGSLSIPDGAVLLLEDVNEFMYSFDRALVHLRRAGVFDRISGLVIADMKIKDQGSRDNSLGLLLEEVIDSHFGAFEGPIALDMPCGHTDRKLTIPIGAQTTLTVGDTRLVLEFEDFWKPHPAGVLAA